uniref:Uncharacterized protein n=2 Tax=Aegilops tauschii subsp. strangulata TaxID=200361 RepID=A0A453S034_AEGTS
QNGSRRTRPDRRRDRFSVSIPPQQPAMERNGGKQQQQQQLETAAPAPAPRKGAWRDGAVTYFHLLFYIAISGGQIFFNKASPSHPPPRPASPAHRPAILPAAASFVAAVAHSWLRDTDAVSLASGLAASRDSAPSWVSRVLACSPPRIRWLIRLLLSPCGGDETDVFPASGAGFECVRVRGAFVMDRISVSLSLPQRKRFQFKEGVIVNTQGGDFELRLFSYLRYQALIP